MECFEMFVTKAFPERCCDVAAFCKRLLKHQKVIIILFEICTIVELRWPDVLYEDTA